MNLIKKLKEFDAPLLSHHPLCSSFKDDLIIIKGWKLCLGCTISYPITLGILIFSPWLFYGEWGTTKLIQYGLLDAAVQPLLPAINPDQNLSRCCLL